MKFQRQSKILELIEKNEIETQEELSELLRISGFTTTQATISRDIKELRLVKSLSKSGKYKYVSTLKGTSGEFSAKLRNIFRECVVGIDFAGNMIVIKTLPALGGAAASAIDSMHITDTVGTIAGDDTVFVLMRSEQAAQSFCKSAEKLL